MPDLYLPFEGRVRLTSPFGMRTLNGVTNFHAGIDLVGIDSKILRAPCSGLIRSSTIVTDKSNLTWEWGNYIRIDTSDGMQIFMCHMSQRSVHVGQTVVRGEPVGIEGDSGYSFGSHCHFEVRINGSPVDPTPYLGIPNAVGIYGDKQSDSQNQNGVFGTPGDGNVPHDWARESVEWAIDRGILKGDGTSYRLNDPVTREEMCVLMMRLARL